MSVVGASYLFEATDPRDLVYGVLGITNTITRTAQQAQDASIPPWALIIDYTRSTSQVFQDVVRYLTNRDRCLEVLCLVESFGGQPIQGKGGHDVGLPTWTPDWRKTSSFSTNRVLYMFGLGWQWYREHLS